MSPDAVSEAIGPLGLMVRGGFHPSRDDRIPDFADGKPVATVMMEGNAGPAMWEMFSLSPERSLNVDPLNSWTRRVIGEVISSLDARAIYPFDGPPYYPFQRWARQSEPVWSSPIGILIHPEFGLWHGYRAALLFKDRLALPAPIKAHNPCERCVEQPCLKSCPVSAFTGSSYEVTRCVSHISTEVGSDCISLGCEARRACPIGVSFCYDSPQAGFHQRAFLRSHLRSEIES